MRRMYESAGQIRNLLGRKIKMKIRKLETGEKLNTRKLYEEVFSEDSKDFVDYYYEEKVKDNQIYVVEEDGEIQAMLHLNPYELAVNGSRKELYCCCCNEKIISETWLYGRNVETGVK